MKISIIGLGWFGTALAEALKDQHQIFGTTRSVAKKAHFDSSGIHSYILTPPEIPQNVLFSSDVIVINIPPFKDQTSWFKSWPWDPNAHIIFISSTSVYGELTGELNESTVPQPTSDQGKELFLAEKYFSNFPRATIIRFGGLFGANRHPGKVLSGQKNLQGGNWPVNLIHLDDTVAFTRMIINEKITSETFNLVHPDHPTREKFYQSYCTNQMLPLPEFVRAESPGKIISSQKVSSLYKFCRNSVT